MISFRVNVYLSFFILSTIPAIKNSGMIYILSLKEDLYGYAHYTGWYLKLIEGYVRIVHVIYKRIFAGGDNPQHRLEWLKGGNFLHLIPADTSLQISNLREATSVIITLIIANCHQIVGLL